MFTSSIDPDLRIRAQWGPEIHAAYDRFRPYEEHAYKVLEFLDWAPLELVEALVNHVFLPTMKCRQLREQIRDACARDQALHDECTAWEEALEAVHLDSEDLTILRGLSVARIESMREIASESIP